MSPHDPKVIDNDRDEISVMLNGNQVRGWSYEDETERRWKMRMAREFIEGWHSGIDYSYACAEGRV